MRQSAAEIAGVIHSNDISADTRIQQSNTWEQEIAILKEQLRPLDSGELLFEYSIPRMGKAWSSSSPSEVIRITPVSVSITMGRITTSESWELGRYNPFYNR